MIRVNRLQELVGRIDNSDLIGAVRDGDRVTGKPPIVPLGENHQLAGRPYPRRNPYPTVGFLSKMVGHLVVFRAVFGKLSNVLHGASGRIGTIGQQPINGLSWVQGVQSDTRV